MFKYILLGTIQGITEFLPVSSSGHLVILQKTLGMQGTEVPLFLVLHLGTLVAVTVFLFKDIKKALTDIKMILFISVVTLITGTIGVLGKTFFEGLFSSSKIVAFALVLNGIVLILTRREKGVGRKQLSLRDSFVLGFAQAAAIVPGISRSGVTISSLLFRKVDKELSFKISFLVSLPVIAGAFLLEIRGVNFALRGNLLNYAAGFMSSLLTGLLALSILKVFVRKARLYLFGYYCLFAAAVIFLFLK